MRQSSPLRFLKNLAVLAVLLFITDLAIGSLIKRLYFGLKKGQYAQTTFVMDSLTKTDIIVLGSSRAMRHYSTSVISSITGLSCYNTGKDGQFMPYYAAVQEVFLKKHKPKMLIIDVNVWDLDPTDEKYEKLSALLPYAQDHPELMPYLNEISHWEKLKLFSKTYPFNSTLLIACHNYFFPERVTKDLNGYMPLVGTIQKKDLEQYEKDREEFEKKWLKRQIVTDKKALNYYISILDKATRADIKTWVIISPTILQEPETIQKSLIATIAHRYPAVTFIDFTKNKKYNYQNNKFADIFHLNNEGSSEFSAEIAQLLLNRKLQF